MIKHSIYKKAPINTIMIRNKKTHTHTHTHHTIMHDILTVGQFTNINISKIKSTTITIPIPIPITIREH